MNFVGVNGCKAGWLAIALTKSGHASHRVAADFADLAQAFQPALILVDVPIGLREDGRERLCDTAARQVLGLRASSVFPAPCRSALKKPDYNSASRENKLRTGRRLSKQSWALFPKIRQVDEYLCLHSGTGPVVREVHPEVCFWAFAGHPMRHAKRKPEGLAERLAVLSSVFSGAAEAVREIEQAHRRAELGSDDALDALVAGVTALEGAEDLRTLPDAPELDGRGLRMEMVYGARGPASGVTVT